MTTVGVFLFPGVEELDFVGPWEVLGAWERVWPDDGQHVLLLAREEGTITCAMGMRVEPEATWATAPPLDVLVYPGGQGTVAQLGDETIRTWPCTGGPAGHAGPGREVRRFIQYDPAPPV